jgi:alkyldihydroxyacetonephosphate synthase
VGHDHEELTDRLVEIVGAHHVSRTDTDPYRLKARRRGRRGETTWVVQPGAASEIAEVLRIAAEARLAVLPVGTATRRFAWTQGPDRPFLVVDLKRMAHVLHLDESSLIVHAQAGLTGLKLEELLLPRGLTLGDFPPAALRSSLGGLLAVRTPGKSSPRHGLLEDAVLGISAVLGDGRTIHTRVAPRRATGPDLQRALLGSEGTLGIITAVVLRIHRRSDARLLDAQRFPSLDAAVAAFFEILRKDARPAAMRVYDAEEARVHLGGEAAGGDEAVAVIAAAGPPELAACDRDLFAAAAQRAGATPLGAAVAEIWWRRRSGHSVPGPTPPPPNLTGAAAPSRIVAVYHAAIAAARAASVAARAHISRFHDDGACLFVTLAGGDKPVLQSTRAAIETAMRGAGASLVGDTDEALRPYLRALRAELDPQGILNPDVLA